MPATPIFDKAPAGNCSPTATLMRSDVLLARIEPVDGLKAAPLPSARLRSTFWRFMAVIDAIEYAHSQLRPDSCPEVDASVLQPLALRDDGCVKNEGQER